LGELENIYNKQNSTDQQVTTNKQPFTNRYGRTYDNQKQPFISRNSDTNSAQPQQVTGRYAQAKSTQQNNAQQPSPRQPNQQPMGGTGGQTQYASKIGTKTIRCLVSRDDTNYESAIEEEEVDIDDDPKKHIRGGYGDRKPLAADPINSEKHINESHTASKT